MKKITILVVLIVIISALLACQLLNRFSSNMSGAVADNTAETQPNTEPDSAENAELAEATATKVVAAPNQSGASQESEAGDGLPASTIFDQDWQDYGLYESGLISSERAILNQLDGASVYHLTLNIADDLSTLSGRQEVKYTNMEVTTLSEIYFHLYPNLLGGTIAISNLTVNGTPVPPILELKNSALKVDLIQPLSVGEAVIIGLDFAVTVPQTQERNYGIFANVNGIMAAAHFYPLIAVYDDQGWDIEIPSPQGDVVFADTSFFVVQISAPKSATIVASGVPIERQQRTDNQTVTFAAGPMRDFYFVTTDQYEVVSETVGETTINSYYLPGRADSARQALTYAVDSLHSFNRRYGIYPFVEFDIVPTANLALGIEYPGIVAINEVLYDPNAKLGDWPVTIFFEFTVVHEVAHQWFYSLIGNDQLAEPWVDEAITQYATWRYYVDTYGQTAADSFEQALRSRWERLESAEIPIGRPVGSYDGAEYSAIVYGRGPLFVDALANQMGQESFDQFLRDFALQNRWGLVSAADFEEQAERHCACDLSELFAAWVYDQ